MEVVRNFFSKAKSSEYHSISSQIKNLTLELHAFKSKQLKEQDLMRYHARYNRILSLRARHNEKFSKKQQKSLDIKFETFKKCFQHLGFITITPFSMVNSNSDLSKTTTGSEGHSYRSRSKSNANETQDPSKHGHDDETQNSHTESHCVSPLSKNPVKRQTHQRSSYLETGGQIKHNSSNVKEKEGESNLAKVHSNRKYLDTKECDPPTQSGVLNNQRGLKEVDNKKYACKLAETESKNSIGHFTEEERLCKISTGSRNGIINSGDTQEEKHQIRRLEQSFVRQGSDDSTSSTSHQHQRSFILRSEEESRSSNLEKSIPKEIELSTYTEDVHSDLVRKYLGEKYQKNVQQEITISTEKENENSLKIPKYLENIETSSDGRYQNDCQREFGEEQSLKELQKCLFETFQHYGLDSSDKGYQNHYQEEFKTPKEKEMCGLFGCRDRGNCNSLDAKKCTYNSNQALKHSTDVRTKQQTSGLSEDRSRRGSSTKDIDLEKMKKTKRKESSGFNSNYDNAEANSRNYSKMNKMRRGSFTNLDDDWRRNTVGSEDCLNAKQLQNFETEHKNQNQRLQVQETRTNYSETSVHASIFQPQSERGHQNCIERDRFTKKETYSNYGEEEKEAVDKPLEVLDVHQYFRDDFDVKSLDNIADNLVKIDTIESWAKPFELLVSNFSEDGNSLEYFILDEKLMRLIEAADRIKDQSVTDRKVQVIEYIKKLQLMLDSRATDN